MGFPSRIGRPYLYEMQNRHSFDILRGVWYTVRVYELKQSEMY